MNYYNSYEMGVAGTYIISLPGNPVSEQLTNQCFQSCIQVGQPNPMIVPGFDASGSQVKLQEHELGKPVGELGTIKVPEALQGQAFINFLRLHRADMLMTQIACFLSHYSLWCLCLAMDRPIVILEHDAIMVKPYQVHKYYNNIVYLGSKEQYKHGKEVYSIPPHASDHKGLDRFICRAHAYAIDPAIAKNMVSYVIQQGMTTSLDAILRSDLFGIVQDGVYAYDENHGLSTIAEGGRAVG